MKFLFVVKDTFTSFLSNTSLCTYLKQYLRPRITEPEINFMTVQIISIQINYEHPIESVYSNG